MTVELYCNEFYDEVDEFGGFNEEFTLTFLKVEDADKFYKEVKTGNFSSWVSAEKKNNTVILHSWGD